MTNAFPQFSFLKLHFFLWSFSPFLAMNKLFMFLSLFVFIATSSASLDADQYSFYHLERACNTSLYPRSCFSSMYSKVKGSMISNSKLTKVSVEMALESAENVYALFIQRQRDIGVYKEIPAPLSDCIFVMNRTLDHLIESTYKLELDINSLVLDNVRTWLSASLTNLHTCIDGLTPGGLSLVRQVHKSSRYVSYSLAMANMLSQEIQYNKHNLEHSQTTTMNEQPRFPEWVKNADRKLLQAPRARIQVNMIVAKDGIGHFSTISEAIKSAPKKSDKRFIIHVRRGIYNERLSIFNNNIMLLGDGAGITVVTGAESLTEKSTQFTATTMVYGYGFIARDMTFENSAGPSKGQAAALLVASDQSVLYRCSITGYQDTLCAYSMRQFYRDCSIYGTVDFIFGNAAAVFQNCEIVAREPLPRQKNMITAQGRTDPNQNTGFSIHNCKVVAAIDLEPLKKKNPTYLGRPWRKYARTVYIQTFLDDLIHPAGWHQWEGSFALKTVYYGEYMNSGPGAGVAKRVRWPGVKTQMSPAEAGEFTVTEFISGNVWLPSTGIAYQAGLIV